MGSSLSPMSISVKALTSECPVEGNPDLKNRCNDISSPAEGNPGSKNNSDVISSPDEGNHGLKNLFDDISSPAAHFG